MARRESSVGGTVQHSASSAIKLKPSAIANNIAGDWGLGAGGWDEESEPPIPSPQIQFTSSHVAPAARTACANKCMLNSGFCHRSRPFAWANKNAVYTAVRAARMPPGQSKRSAIPFQLNIRANNQTPSTAPYAVIMYAPRTNHDFH